MTSFCECIHKPPGSLKNVDIDHLSDYETSKTHHTGASWLGGYFIVRWFYTNFMYETKTCSCGWFQQL
jgi:hypothetical protein